MTALLMGKLTYSTLLAFAQLVLMFVWAWAVFKLDLLSHIPGFVVMGVATSGPRWWHCSRWRRCCSPSRAG